MSAPVPPTRDRRQTLFLVLSAIFLTNALLAEMIGGKLFQVDLLVFDAPATLSCGVLLWPVVFIVSDLINEYFGRRGVRKLSLLGAVMIAYAFVALFAAGAVPPLDPVQGAAYESVFLQSQWIIAGSITAFLLAQLLDVTVFRFLRRRTGPAALWLRATGSTVVSQLVDTLVVGFIGLHLPHLLDPTKGYPLGTVLSAAGSSYAFKFLVAVLSTPVLYAVHAGIDRYLGPEAARMADEAARD